MSYISAITRKNEVWVWERNENGREIIKYPGIFEFYAKNKSGQHQSLYDEPLQLYSYDTNDEFQQFKQLIGNGGFSRLYESDIRPELKVLSKQYHNVTAPKLQFTLWDIEVDYHPDKGFPSVENPYAPINAVAIHHVWSGRSVVIAVPPPIDNWDKDELLAVGKEANTEIVIVKNERELLEYFLYEIQDSDCLSGWNSDAFDTPYTAKRIERVLGPAGLRQLSFDNCTPPNWTTVEVYGQEQQRIILGGRISWDYMELFKKFEASERPSYSLEAISNEILPELPKLSYPKTLYHLYNFDFVYFIKYNVRDTDVLKGFEKKLGYLQLANDLYHSACGLPAHIFGTIKLTDLSMINFCHYTLNKKVPDVDMNAAAGRIAGAMVLTPQRGLAKLLGSVDVESLYPSDIRTVNISPDTLVGQLDGTLTDDDRQMHSGWELVFKQDTKTPITVVYDQRAAKLGYTGTETHTGAEWFNIIYDRKWSISGFGTIFRQDVQGMIPAVLSEWFSQRKHYKKLKEQSKQQAEDIKKKYPKIEDMTANDLKLYNEQLELSAYYDRLQYVYKIKLNATYGATTNAYFRFFDLRLGQSTTGSGRAILDHMCSQVALELDGDYNMFSPSIIYGDTDSCYFRTNAESFTEKTKQEQEEIAIQIADMVGERVSKSFDDFCVKAFRIQPEFKGIIRCEREVVAKSGIFVTKKRYVLKLIDLDGRRVDKLKAMGLEMKKTTTPKVIQNFLEDVVKLILDGEKTWEDINAFIVSYRDQITHILPILDIGMPKGVKKVEHYTGEYETYGDKARLPGHVAASIFYNRCLKEHHDTESMPIISNSKIKVFYLSRKYGKFKSIAFPTDTENLPEWFTTHYMVDRIQHEQKLIDNPLQIIFNALDREVPTSQSLFNESVLEWD